MKTCPNCGELVGNRVEVCFNCKYSFRYKRVVKGGDDITVQDMVNEICSGFGPDLYYTLLNFIEKADYDGAILSIQNYYYCDIETATNILALFKEQIYYPHEKRLKEARARALARGVGTPSNYVPPNEPKCPTCGSTLVKRLSALSRGASVAVWGATSNKFNKSFECKNCGYTW